MGGNCHPTCGTKKCRGIPRFRDDNISHSQGYFVLLSAVDFPENVQMKRLSPSLKEKEGDLHVPLLDSTMHHDYKVPVLNRNLKGNTTRYGCNAGIVKAAHGAVPTLDKQTLPPMSKYKTWYSSDFGRLSSGARGGERQTKHKNHVTIHLPALVNSQAATRSPKAGKRSRKVNQ